MAYFHPIFIAGILSFASSTVFAENSCNVNLSTGIEMNTDSIEFFQTDDENNEATSSLYKIVNHKDLIINNKKVMLSDSQQTLLIKYDTQIRHLVPKVKQVAIEGLDLAIEGVNSTFNAMLGNNNAISTDLTKELIEIKNKVTTNLSVDNGISIGVNGIESEELLGKDFEERIESTIEKAVLNSMGSILIAIGREMVNGEGSDENFETRMNNFSENIEHEMTTRTEIIEQKAESLCVDIIELDTVEEQLKMAIKPLNNINIFTVIKHS